MKRKNNELMTLKVIKTSSEDETIELGFKIGKNCKGGEIIALVGDLGSGKTNFVKGLGKGLGIINRVITSPTFVICQSYTSGRLPLFHLDLYRLSDFQEVEDIGWYDFVSSKGVIVIEWAEKIKDYITLDNLLWISIQVLSDNIREFVFKAKSKDMGYLFKTIKE